MAYVMYPAPMGVGPHDPIRALPVPRPDETDIAGIMAAKSVRKHENVLRRREDFEHRHPEVTITPHNRTVSGLWEADWPGNDEPVGHDKCAGLLNYLEARFDRGDLREPQ